MTGARAVSRLNRGTAGAALLLALACVVDPAHGQITLAQKVTLKQFIAAPSNLQASGWVCVIYLGWTDNSFNESGFQIEQRYPGGNWSVRVEVPRNITTVSVPDGGSGTPPEFRVRAFLTDSLGGRVYSAYSNIASATSFCP